MIAQQLQCVRQRLSQLDASPSKTSDGQRQLMLLIALKTEAQRLFDEWSQFTSSTPYRHRTEQVWAVVQ